MQSQSFRRLEAPQLRVVTRENEQSSGVSSSSDVRNLEEVAYRLALRLMEWVNDAGESPESRLARAQLDRLEDRLEALTGNQDLTPSPRQATLLDARECAAAAYRFLPLTHRSGLALRSSDDSPRDHEPPEIIPAP